jgi:hypothetical protein
VAVYWVLGWLACGLVALAHSDRAPAMIGVAALSMVLGCFGFGNGPVIGCTLVLLAVLLGRPWRQVAVLAATFAVVLLFYTSLLPGAGTGAGAIALRPAENVAVALRWLSGVWIQAWIGLPDHPSGFMRAAMEQRDTGGWLIASADWLARRTVSSSCIEPVILRVVGVYAGCRGFAQSPKLLVGSSNRNVCRVGLGSRQERRQLPELGSFGVLTPQTQGVQMAGAVVAAGAVDMRHPEQVLTHSRSTRVDVILIGATAHAATHKPVDLTHLIAISALHGDQLAGHLVIRFPVGERIANPGVHGENTLLVHRHLCVLAGVLEQVTVIHGPLVQPLGGIDQFVHKSRALVG